MEVVAPRLTVAATPPPYESAHVQNAWLYPRRINMVANPRVEEDPPGTYPFWRSSVTAGNPGQFLDDFQRANGPLGPPWSPMPHLHSDYRHVDFAIDAGGLVNAIDTAGGAREEGTAYWATPVMRTQFVELKVAAVGFAVTPEPESPAEFNEYRLIVQYDPNITTGLTGYEFHAAFYHPSYYEAGVRPEGALQWGIAGPGPTTELNIPEAAVPVTLTQPWAPGTIYTLRIETDMETISVFLDGVLLAKVTAPPLGGHHVGFTQRWRRITPANPPRIEQAEVGSMIPGVTLGKCVWETNMMEGRPGFWTIQLQAKGSGYLKVGLVFWHPDDPTDIDTDWGTQTWQLSLGGWTHINCLRFSSDMPTVQLRIELMGSNLEIDYVVCEPGALLGWEYFDGDTIYGATDDHNWWGNQGAPGIRGAGYSGWYDNKRSVNGVVFNSTFIRETPTDLAPPPPEGAVYAKWGHTPTFYSYWQDANSGVVNPLWGPQPGTTFEALSGEQIDELLAADLLSIDSSLSERRSGTVYRWMPSGTKVMAHWDVMYPYDLQLAPTDVSGSSPRSYIPATFPAQYLVPTVGTAVTSHGPGDIAESGDVRVPVAGADFGDRHDRQSVRGRSHSVVGVATCHQRVSDAHDLTQRNGGVGHDVLSPWSGSNWCRRVAGLGSRQQRGHLRAHRVHLSRWRELDPVRHVIGRLGRPGLRG